MKKLLAFTLALAAVLSLAACGDTDDDSSRKKSKKAKDSSSVSSALDSSSDEETTTTTTTASETTATTTTTAAETTATAAEPEKEYSIAAIVGDWYIDGDPNTAHLSIHEDGTFESYLATGGLEYKGTVTAGVYDLGDLAEKGEYFCFKNDDRGESSFAFYIPYTESQAVEFTTAGSVSLHFLPLQEEFELPENMPFSYSCNLNKSSGIDLLVNADGSFEGLYLGYDLNDKNERVEVFSHFTGQLSSLKDEGNGCYSMMIESIKAIKGVPDESSSFKTYVTSKAMDVSDRFGTIGLFKGDTLYLYQQGTKYDDLPEELVKAVKDNEEKDDMISDIYLYASDAGLAFRSS